MKTFFSKGIFANKNTNSNAAQNTKSASKSKGASKAAMKAAELKANKNNSTNNTNYLGNITSQDNTAYNIVDSQTFTKKLSELETKLNTAKANKTACEELKNKFEKIWFCRDAYNQACEKLKNAEKEVEKCQKELDDYKKNSWVE